MAAAEPPWTSPEWVARTRLLLNSYQQFVGRELIPRRDPLLDSQNLFEAGIVVVAHGTQDDPLLNYGNLAALTLWQLPLEKLIGMPSRKTAEPVHRDERAVLLRRTLEAGFIDDYSGIRIASTGERFRIEHATVWNVVDDNGDRAGQAAAFSDWTMLNKDPAP